MHPEELLQDIITIEAAYNDQGDLVMKRTHIAEITPLNLALLHGKPCEIKHRALEVSYDPETKIILVPKL